VLSFFLAAGTSASLPFPSFNYIRFLSITGQKGEFSLSDAFSGTPLFLFFSTSPVFFLWVFSPPPQCSGTSPHQSTPSQLRDSENLFFFAVGLAVCLNWSPLLLTHSSPPFNYNLFCPPLLVESRRPHGRLSLFLVRKLLFPSRLSPFSFGGGGGFFQKKNMKEVKL